MAFEELFKEYPNKNMELRACAKTAYEFGKTAAKEQSAGSSLGLLEAATERQRNYVLIMKGMIKALHDRPIPDMPYMHPTQFEIDLSDPYLQTTVDDIPINEDTELLAQYWMTIAVELAASQSAGLAGSLTDADFTRIDNDLDVISQLLDAIDDRPPIDLPETAFPGALETVPKKKVK